MTPTEHGCSSDTAGQDASILLKQTRARLVSLAVVVLLVVGAIVGVNHFVRLLDADESVSLSAHRVGRGDLMITVTEAGSIESCSNKQLKCKLDKGGMILSLVQDGTQVGSGDVIVEFDAAPIRNEIARQRIAVEKAKASYVQARVDVDVAEISIEEYLKGTYLKQMQEMESQITVAKEDVERAYNALDYTQRIMRKGYATPLQVHARRFAVERAQLELATRETDKRVLQKYTKAKVVRDLRAKQEATAARRRAAEATVAIEESKLELLERQLGRCIIRAPQDGMVVYPNASSRWAALQGEPIAEGASIRPLQTVVHLPDLSQMQVRVAVHETRAHLVRPGMPAVIDVQDRILKGTVVSVAPQPNAGGWVGANTQEYATIVRIHDQIESLRPGMTAKVTILVDYVQDVLLVPVEAVIGKRGAFYCWIANPRAPERRRVLIGRSNAEFIEVKEGLLQGDDVLLNPTAVMAD